MAKPGLENITTSQTFQTWLDRTNEIVDIFNSDVITASASGDTTGSIGAPLIANLIGTFNANTVSVSDGVITNSLTPFSGVSTFTVNAQVFAESPLQTAAVFRASQGGRTSYSSFSNSWSVGFENTTTNAFMIDNGVGPTKFRLTTNGNLSVSGTITSTLGFIGDLTGDVEGDVVGNVTGNVVGNLSGEVTLTTQASTSNQAVRADRNISTGTGLTGGGNLTSDRTLSLTGQALALHNLNTTGVLVRSGSDSFATRTISDGDGIDITNGDGISGNPIISVDNSVVRTTRSIIAGTGLSGGGTLYNNVSLNVNFATFGEGNAGTLTTKPMSPFTTLSSIRENAIKGYILFNGNGIVEKTKNLSLSKQGTGLYRINCSSNIQTSGASWGVVITNIDSGSGNRTPSITGDAFTLDLWNVYVSSRDATGFNLRAVRRWNQLFGYEGLFNDDGGASQFFGVSEVDPSYIALVVF